MAENEISRLNYWPPPDFDGWSSIPERDRASYQFTNSGDYCLGPSSRPHENVRAGQLFAHTMDDCAAYPGVVHDYWVYVPAQADQRTYSDVMIFLDGALFLDPKVCAPIVLDNLIHEGTMPPVIGLFVAPGDKGPGLPLWGGNDNRSLEYDTVNAVFADFLLEELIPSALASHGFGGFGNIGVAGISSSGAAAFTAAWNRSDRIQKVISFVGSFTDIRGANCYPSVVRRSSHRPIRTFLQTGARDLDIVFGNWLIANQDLASALAYREYEYQLVVGEGGHSLKHGAAILPDALRWAWGA